MKYIIFGSEFDPTVLIGNCNHQILGEAALRNRKPRSAGHVRIVNGKVEVFGESIGYDIKAKPEDAEIIEHYLVKVC